MFSWHNKKSRQIISAIIIIILILANGSSAFGKCGGIVIASLSLSYFLHLGNLRLRKEHGESYEK